MRVHSGVKNASIPTCAVVLMAALLAGCEVTSAPSAPAASSLTYFRDDARGLCFAAISSQTSGGYKVVSITNVPCATTANSVGTETQSVEVHHETGEQP